MPTHSMADPAPNTLPAYHRAVLSPIPAILDDIRAGKMVILVDDENRENEGDLVLAAQHVTPETINFMLTVARGYLCLSLSERDCDRLDLHPQSPVNTSVRGTPLTVSIDGHPRHGFTTGVSAHERARAIKLAIDPSSGPADFVRPGHINPLRSRDGGVLVRTGQTEGSVDLCRLAGLYPAAVIIEVMREDGHMARMPDLEQLAQKHDIKICSVAQIIEHRLSGESLVRRIEPVRGTTIETDEGPFTLYAFQSAVDPQPHLALTVGDIGALDADGRTIEHPEPILVRMHRRDLLGDIFGYRAPNNSAEPSSTMLRASMRAIRNEGRGAVVYLRTHLSDSDDLSQKLITIREGFHPRTDDDAPSLTTPSTDPGAVRQREVGIGCQILRSLGLSRLRLLTNQKKELPGLDAFGLEIVEQVALR